MLGRCFYDENIVLWTACFCVELSIVLFLFEVAIGKYGDIFDYFYIVRNGFKAYLNLVVLFPDPL